jgi:hypothetical protein
MRRLASTKKTLEPGDFQTITKFLWWPVTVATQTYTETRWLERASVSYKLIKGVNECYIWTPVCFNDN